jgi:hypothetical protein
MTTPLLLELKTFPLLWEKICNSSSTPDVDSMISLLKEAGFLINARLSGSTCIKTIHQYKHELEAFLAQGKKEEAPPPPPEPEPEPEPEETEAIRKEAEEFDYFSTFPFDPDSQCEFTLESEAIERLKYCIGTSFRTDAGIIMLENDLSMFDEVTPDQLSKWVLEMRDTWKNRLHSKIVAEFEESLDLWVASKQK